MTVTSKQTPKVKIDTSLYYRLYGANANLKKPKKNYKKLLLVGQYS